ncbi:hypothetical protein KPH14_012027 [Odynerus spinipes]|uniref:Peptidase A2 domain-containing protein n=1 Tax=Odynerus spinipes TaxID=1348599 RepID=A0AAD9VL41_9HYME|nr:hypothetical protein KPH14_012027 [Odynerus spinipes]
MKDDLTNQMSALKLSGNPNSNVEKEMRASTSTERETRSARSYYSVKDAADLVPNFDGQKVNVMKFISAYESAQELLHPQDLPLFAKVIRLKITGEAENFIRYVETPNLEMLTLELKRMYVPRQSLTKWQTELAFIKQNSWETPLEFGRRVQEIETRAKEIITENNTPEIALGMIKGLEHNALNSFVAGLLNPELENEVCNANPETLNQAIDNAITSWEYLKNRHARLKATFNSPFHVECQQYGETQHDYEHCPYVSRPKTAKPNKTKIHFVRSNTTKPPVVTLQSTVFKKQRAEFLVDTGADISLVKENEIVPEAHRNFNKTINLKGITSEITSTIAEIPIEINKNMHNLHIVAENFPIKENGILGSDFLEKEQATLSYPSNSLEISKGTVLPFKQDTITIPPRTASVIPVQIQNSENFEIGILKDLSPAEGVFVGRALAENRNGLAYTYAINSKETETSFTIPSTTLEAVEINEEGPKQTEDCPIVIKSATCTENIKTIKPVHEPETQAQRVNRLQDNLRKRPKLFHNYLRRPRPSGTESSANRSRRKIPRQQRKYRETNSTSETDSDDENTNKNRETNQLILNEENNDEQLSTDETDASTTSDTHNDKAFSDLDDTETEQLPQNTNFKSPDHTNTNDTDKNTREVTEKHISGSDENNQNNENNYNSDNSDRIVTETIVVHADIHAKHATDSENTHTRKTLTTDNGITRKNNDREINRNTTYNRPKDTRKTVVDQTNLTQDRGQDFMEYASDKTPNEIYNMHENTHITNEYRTLLENFNNIRSAPNVTETPDNIFITKDSGVHFISADGNISLTTEKLITQKLINKDDLNEKLAVGEILASRKRNRYIYTIVVKENKGDQTTLENLFNVFNTLKTLCTSHSTKSIAIEVKDLNLSKFQLTRKVREPGNSKNYETLHTSRVCHP